MAEPVDPQTCTARRQEGKETVRKASANTQCSTDTDSRARTKDAVYSANTAEELEEILLKFDPTLRPSRQF